MLILKRKRGETIVITTGDATIVLTVTECGSKGVKLGFAAPESVRVFREEIIRKDPA